jgi:hypothetical protein
MESSVCIPGSLHYSMGRRLPAGMDSLTYSLTALGTCVSFRKYLMAPGLPKAHNRILCSPGCSATNSEIAKPQPRNNHNPHVPIILLLFFRSQSPWRQGSTSGVISALFASLGQRLRFSTEHASFGGSPCRESIFLLLILPRSSLIH